MVSVPEGLRAGWHLTGKGTFVDPFLHLHPLRDVENSTTICGTIYAKHSFLLSEHVAVHCLILIYPSIHLL